MKEEPRLTKPSYAQALKPNKNTLEKVNSTNHPENKPNKNTNERLDGSAQQIEDQSKGLFGQ